MGFLVEVTPDPSGEGTYTPPGVTVPAPSADTGFILKYSVNADRSSPANLHGATLPAVPVYIFATTSTQDQVVFTLDGVDVRTDNATPFDFTGNSGAIALAAVGLTAGTRRIGAKSRFGGGTSYTHVEATFTAVDTLPGVDPNNPYTAFASTSVATSIGFSNKSSHAFCSTMLGRQIKAYTSYPTKGQTIATLISSAKSLLTGGWATDTSIQTIMFGIVTVLPVNGSDQRTLAYGAAGGYDAYWDDFGDSLALLSDAKLKRLVLCFGWEMNGEWFEHRVSPKGTGNTPDITLCHDFADYVIRIVARLTAKLTAAQRALVLMEICWSGGAANTASKRATLKTHLFDRVYASVDVVAADNYGFSPGNDAVAARAFFDWQVAQCVERTKMFAVNETGAGCRVIPIPGDSFKASWAAGTAYTVGQVVVRDDSYWRAVANSTGVTPGSDPTKWQQAYIHRGNYSGATVYNKSDLVTSGGTEWTARVTTTGVTPSSSTSTQWQRSWESAANDGDEPEWYQMIHDVASILVPLKLLKNIHLFEEDKPSERLYTTVLDRAGTRPGYESTVIPGTTRVANVPTNFPNSSRKVLDLWEA